MTGYTLLLIILASFGISLGIFFSVILFNFGRPTFYANRILALLIFFLSLRIAKSVFYNFIELPVYIKNLGLAFNLSVGPLLFMYGLSLTNPEFRLSGKHLLHFIPALLYVLFCQLLPNHPEHAFWTVSYSLVLTQSFVYVFLSLRLWQTAFNKVGPKAGWYFNLCIGLAVMWIIYLLIFIQFIPVYLAGAFSFTLLVSILTYLGFRERYQLMPVFYRKYSGSSLSAARSHQLFERVEGLVNDQLLFLDRTITLGKLAREAEVSAKLLSQVINENTHKNFQHFINSHRIEHAKKLLSDQNGNGKILSIALESGFSSLSSFNTFFKQLTSMTPSEYRSKIK